MSASLAGSLPKGSRRLLGREWERRTGGQTLPFELEQDVDAAFGDASGEQG